MKTYINALGIDIENLHTAVLHITTSFCFQQPQLTVLDLIERIPQKDGTVDPGLEHRVWRGLAQEVPKAGVHGHHAFVHARMHTKLQSGRCAISEQHDDSQRFTTHSVRQRNNITGGRLCPPTFVLKDKLPVGNVNDVRRQRSGENEP